jgi:hypothetical protein
MFGLKFRKSHNDVPYKDVMVTWILAIEVLCSPVASGRIISARRCDRSGTNGLKYGWIYFTMNGVHVNSD